MGETASSCNPLSETEEKERNISKLRDKDKWIFYHIPIKCRGNFARLVLEESGVDWIDGYGYQTIDGLFQSPLYVGCADYHELANNDISKLIDPKNNIANIPLKDRIYDVYGSPCLVNFHNPLICLSQTPMIVQFIADKYGLRPKADIDHYLAGMIVANCNDFFDMIGAVQRDIKLNKEKLLEFMNGKYRVWLTMIVKPLGDRLYYFDNRITQSDLALYNILDCLHEIFDSNEKLLNEFAWKLFPNLNVFYKNIVKESKSIAPMMKKQKEAGFTWWPYMGQHNDGFGIKAMQKTLLQYAQNDL